ncbi:hypothetical protein [Crateriforma conspicua]|uniref:Uncharacterized protein n=1 Tax=Crateriforma conspicua TaxID=2527996 RepID=A0A5C6FRH4_9PLAN|nr:hypothetical protein [Crateriforma conspicua]TWU64846.1 hypothetical protein V7x_03900 [Crateriforma conspicua]
MTPSIYRILCLTLFAFTVAAAGSSNVNAQQDLFSKLSMGEVFEEADSDSTSDGNDLQQLTRLIRKNPELLKQLLSAVETESPKDAASSPAAAEPKKSTADATKPTPASVAELPAKPRISLVGRWSTRLPGGDAMAIEFAKDASFVLVHLKGQKPNISRGKATRGQDVLTLVGDDKLTLRGKLNIAAADRFDWTLGTTTLRFDRAK